MPEPIALTANCVHDYAFRILGGHPMHVRICTFCHTPDWADLAEQANVLYRWGHEEALAGKPPRDRLRAYDRPSRDAAEPEPDPLAPFRVLADQYAAKAAESTRNANTAPLTIRTANQGIAAGWRSAEFLLRHTINNLDNPPASEDAEACCVCGGGPVVYQNYRDQLFCKHCSECDCGLPDGRCTVPVCPDCEVRPGQEHADGCDVARCPTTGKQRLTCDRGDACAGHLCRTLWTGRLPTPTPDQYLEQVRLTKSADIIVDRIRTIAVDLRNDPDARYWANLIDTALDTPETAS